MSKKLKFGLPKGSLQDATIEKMAKAGFNISISSRSYIPTVDDDEMEIRLIRAQEISRYIPGNWLSGLRNYWSRFGRREWLKSSRGWRISFQQGDAPARALGFGLNGRKILIKSVKGLNGKRIATEVVNLTKKYLKKNGVKAEVEFSWGATESRAHGNLWTRLSK